MVSIELLSILLPLEACLVEADTTVRWAKVNSDDMTSEELNGCEKRCFSPSMMQMI